MRLPDSISGSKQFNDALNAVNDQMGKLKPVEEAPRRTSAPGVMNTGSTLTSGSTIRRYSEEYRDRNYRKFFFVIWKVKIEKSSYKLRKLC
jgi:hypothetical protein